MEPGVAKSGCELKGLNASAYGNSARQYFIKAAMSALAWNQRLFIGTAPAMKSPALALIKR
jgi:hypothetical protein